MSLVISHVSRLVCQASHIRCMLCLRKKGKSGGISQWRTGYPVYFLFMIICLDNFAVESGGGQRCGFCKAIKLAQSGSAVKDAVPLSFYSLQDCIK